MGRIRTIKPEFPQSESMGRVSRDARLLFLQLFTLADDSGRLRGNSRMLASLLYPYDDDAGSIIDGWMSELERESCIRRYKYEGDTYLEIANFLKHQKIDKPSPSKLPAFDDSSRIVANPREDSPQYQVSGSRKGSGIKDQEGIEFAERSDEHTAESPPLGNLPCLSNKQWPFTKDDIKSWTESYPAVDVMQELREMRQWLISNPKRGKTYKGMRNFITNWLAKEQDKPRRSNGGIESGTRPAGRIYANERISPAVQRELNSKASIEEAGALLARAYVLDGASAEQLPIAGVDHGDIDPVARRVD
jgi:hypothetical protein